MSAYRFLKPALGVLTVLVLAGAARAAVIADFDAVTNPFSDAGGATNTVGSWWTSPAVGNSYKTVAPSGYIGAFQVSLPRSGGLTDLLLSHSTLSFDYIVPNHAAPGDDVNPNPNAGIGYINSNLVVASDVDGWGWTSLPSAGLFLGNEQTWDWTGTYSYNYQTSADTSGRSLYSLLSHWNQGQGTYLNLVFIQQSGGAATVIRDNFQVTGVPEPACVGLLALGGLSILARRRR